MNETFQLSFSYLFLQFHYSSITSHLVGSRCQMNENESVKFTLISINQQSKTAKSSFKNINTNLAHHQFISRNKIKHKSISHIIPDSSWKYHKPLSSITSHLKISSKDTGNYKYSFNEFFNQHILGQENRLKYKMSRSVLKKMYNR